MGCCVARHHARLRRWRAQSNGHLPHRLQAEAVRSDLALRSAHVLEQYLDDLELPVARARANAPRLSQAIRALRRRRRSEAAAALQAYLEGLREYLDAVAAIRPPHLAALVGNTLERTFEFWTDAATKLAAGTSSAWKCRWQKLAWEIVEGDRQWVSAIDMLAAHHGVTPPQWFAEHRRQLRRTLVL